MYSDSRGHKILQFYVVPIIEQNKRNFKCFSTQNTSGSTIA